MRCDKLQVQGLADRSGTKSVYLWQLARGHRKASHALARMIESATDKAVTVHDLRPDIFGPAPGVPPSMPDQSNQAAERAA